MKAVGAALLAAIILTAQQNNEAALRKALAANTGSVTLPGGEIEVLREIVLPTGAHDLDIRGTGTIIKAAASFRGRALIVFPAGKNIKIHDLSLDGNRDSVGRLTGLPPLGTMYSRFIPNNGILAEGVTGFEAAQIKATRIAGFTILVNASQNVRIHDVEITESGGFNAQRRNNATGGILLEEGSSDFEVSRCLFGKIRGNGVTVRAVKQGRVIENEFAVLARDAIQINQSDAVTVENNHGRQIGYPVEEVDVQGNVLPSAISVTGDVTHSFIRKNQFEETDGRCMSLGGITGAEVTGNTCSETLFGAILLSGSGNRVSGNHFVKLNMAHKDQPAILSTGIYLESGAKDNTVENNEIGGFGMSKRCVVSQELPDANKIAKNDCSDEASVARLQRAKPH